MKNTWIRPLDRECTEWLDADGYLHRRLRPKLPRAIKHAPVVQRQRQQIEVLYSGSSNLLRSTTIIGEIIEFTGRQ